MRRVSAAGLVIAILSALPMVLSPPAQAASSWHAETLDEGNSTGAFTSTMVWHDQHHVFNQGLEAGQTVLRHGWYDPYVGRWQFETLDAGNSTGEWTTTFAWEMQQHVFNRGLESGTPVLRHGWYDPGAGTWLFETLDAGLSDAQFAAGTSFAGQQHVFSHSLDAGIDALRHGYFDVGIGSWAFETLDAGSSTGLQTAIMVWRNQLHYFNIGRPIELVWCAESWRYCYQGAVTGRVDHGWFENSWRSEDMGVAPILGRPDYTTPTISPGTRFAAFVGADGRQNLALGAVHPESSGTLSLDRFAWYDEQMTSWQVVSSHCFGNSNDDYIAGAAHLDSTWVFVRDPPTYPLYLDFQRACRWSSAIGWDPAPAAYGRSNIAGAAYSAGLHTAVVLYAPYGQFHVLSQGKRLYQWNPQPLLMHEWLDPYQ